MRRRILLTSLGAAALAGSPAMAAGAVGLAGSPATAEGPSAITAESPIAPPPGPAAGPPIAPAPPVPVFTTWTGIYVGGQIGYAWSSGNLDFAGVDPFSAAGISSSLSSSAQGIIGGAHVGYNFQINQLVVGLEGNVDGTSISNTVNASFPGVFGGTIVAAQTSSDIQGSIRARLGLALDRVLLYATGGVAFGGFSTSYSFTGNNNALAALNGGNSFSGQNAFSTTKTGWTAGGGIDYAVTDNWSIFAEYRYTQFGTVSNPGIAGTAFSTVTGLSGAFLNATRSLNQNQVQVGFSYKFAPPPTVVAKY
jgi:outer membrane immunogenic protein